RTWRVIRQTLVQAAAGAAASLVLGLPGACLLYCRRFPGRRLLRAVVAVPFVLPSVVVGVAFRSLLAPGGLLGGLKLDGSFAALVAALVFFNYSVVVRTVGVFWAGLDPRAAQAARSLGASRWRVWRTVTLPALAPAIASAGALAFLFCASAFGVVLILGGTRYGTVETEIWYQTTQLLNLPAAAALSIVQLLVTAAALAAANAARSRQERALRLSPGAGRPLQRADWPAVAVVAIVVVGLVCLPLASLVVRSFATPAGWSLSSYAALAGTGHGATAAPIWQAGVNSLATAAAAAALALTLGCLAAYVLSRRPRGRSGRRLLRWADAAFMVPLGVSAATVGFGFLITVNRPPFDLRASWVLIPVAQALVALPLVVRTLLPTWRAIDPRLREAAASLGSGPARLLVSVDVPLIRRGLGLAFGFAFAASLGEFGATSFLARPDRPTLPVVVYRLISRPGADTFGAALAAAVILAVVRGAFLAAAELLAPEEAGW
ncbi:MAG: iron ABC transporter permease, partial [Propionibacteriaceae bacterium]|nr:iron ABC transporter permease [Propionibacteriaceae bacterium]